MFFYRIILRGIVQFTLPLGVFELSAHADDVVRVVERKLLALEHYVRVEPGSPTFTVHRHLRPVNGHKSPFTLSIGHNTTKASMLELHYSGIERVERGIICM